MNFTSRTRIKIRVLDFYKTPLSEEGAKVMAYNASFIELRDRYLNY